MFINISANVDTHFCNKCADGYQQVHIDSYIYSHSTYIKKQLSASSRKNRLRTTNIDRYRQIKILPQLIF